MKGVALVMLVGGWMIAVGGLLVTDETTVRGALAVAGFGTSIAGLFALNAAHVAHAPWKTARGR